MNIFWSRVIDFLPMVVSIIALIISVKAWHKSRVIYGIETEVIRQPTGTKNDMYKDTKHICEKLSSGKYTILGISQRTKSDQDWEIFLGKIRK